MKKTDAKPEVDKMSQWRDEISTIDAQIFMLLKRRFAIVGKIGMFKKQHGLPVRNAQREKELIIEAVKKHKMDKKFIQAFYKTLFKHSYTLEK